MSKLVIVESPTKAKTLKSLLSNEYVLMASNGHVRDLPKSGLGVDVGHNFEPEYVITDKAKKTIDGLRKESLNKELIVLATDPDREGEAIAWHLKYILEEQKKKKGKKVKQPETEEKLKFGRVVFHELTKSAIDEAFKNVGEVNLDLVDAQQARRVLDRLVGYKLSPLLWKKVRYGLSAGRVQSVAVRLIVERERERQQFKPEEYWIIKGNFLDTDGKRAFEAELVEFKDKKLEITNDGDAKKVQTELNNDSFSILGIKRAERKIQSLEQYLQSKEKQVTKDREEQEHNKKGDDGRES